MSGRSARLRTGRDNAPVNWLFRNRQTGEITVAQRPNVALGLFLVASIVNALLDPSGVVGTALTVLAKGALAFWALDELFRGVNPFRRMLGAFFLGLLIVSLTF